MALKMPISEILEMPYDHFAMYVNYARKKPLDTKSTMIALFSTLFALLHSDKKPFKVEDYITFLKDETE